jgi:hypothetical protein
VRLSWSEPAGLMALCVLAVVSRMPVCSGSVHTHGFLIKN